MKKILISGSVAYDNIIEHHDLSIVDSLPEKFHPDIIKDFKGIQEHFGGTGGNIAYNLSLLSQIMNSNVDFKLMTNVGVDFKKYQEHMVSNRINTDYINVHDDDTTSRALVFGSSDNKDNQRSKFYLGATQKSLDLDDDFFNFDIYHLAPEFTHNTAQMAKLLKEKNKAYFFDPGQTIYEMTDKNSSINDIMSMKDIISGATGLFVNEAEAEVLENYMGTSLKNMFSEKMNFIVKTMGSKGVEVYTDKGNEVISMPVFKPERVVDGTGCGDSFRGGFLYGFSQNSDLAVCVKMGSLMGSFAIEHEGGQNHTLDSEKFMKRFFATNNKLKLS